MVDDRVVVDPVESIGPQEVFEFLTTAARASTSRQPVVVISHVRPDADTIGSACAMIQIIEHLGGHAVGVTGDGTPVPEIFEILQGADRILSLADYVASYSPIPEWAIAVDTASSGRCGVAEGIFDAATHSLVIDHHATNTGFGDLTWCDPTVESTTTMIYDLSLTTGIPLTKELAACLYAGLVSDTNSFRWGGPRMFTVASALAATGIDTRTLAVHLLDDHTTAYLRMLGRVLSHCTLEPDVAHGAGLVWTTVTHADIASVTEQDTESVIDVVRWAADADVAMVVKEYDPGEVVVSLRSRARVDVSAVAASLGGGGHRRAAGLTFRGPVEEAVEAVRSALNQLPKGPSQLPAAPNQEPNQGSGHQYRPGAGM